jgi:hypothetical protein
LPLRVAFDLDGVLADMDSALYAEAQGLFGDKLERQQERVAQGGKPSPDEAKGTPPVPPGLNLSARQISRLWRHVEKIDGFWQSLREIEPGAVSRLWTIAVDRRWEVIFLTKRPATDGATAQVQSQRWLAAKGFERPSVYVVQGSRGRIAAALQLDVVVDDRHENCYDVVVDSGARAVLVWRGGGQQFSAAAERLGVEVVRTVGECLDLLTRTDRADSSAAPFDSA